MSTDPDLPRRLRWAASRIDLLVTDPSWRLFSAGFFADPSSTGGSPASGLTPMLVNVHLNTNMWAGDAYEEHVQELERALDLAGAGHRNLQQLAQELRDHAVVIERQIEREQQIASNPFKLPFL